MSTFALSAAVSALLTGLGAAALTRRQGVLGLLVATQLLSGSLVALAATLFALTGRSGALGQVIIAVVVAGAAGSGVLLLALHVAASRARRRTDAEAL